MSDDQRLIGYARVSTSAQSLDLQLDALSAAGCERIFKEKASATKSELPVLTTALETLEAGDVLVVWKLDRVGRSLRHLVATTHDLGERGIGFRSLQENIDTTTPAGRLFFHVMAALAEFEADLISERTKAGLAAARARGRSGGRPKAMTESRTKIARQMLAEEDDDGELVHSVEDVAQTLGVSASSVYRAIRKGATPADS